MTGKLFRTYAKCNCLLKCQVTRKCDDSAFCLNSTQCSIQVAAEQRVRRTEREREGGEEEAIRATINSFGFLCSFSSFALHNSQFLNLNGRKQRGERERRSGGGSTSFDSVDRKMSVPCNEANK